MSSAHSRAHDGAAVQDWRNYGKNARRMSRNSASAGLLATTALLAVLMPLHPQVRISVPPAVRQVLITMETAELPPPIPSVRTDDPEKLLTRESEYRIDEDLPPPPEPTVEKVPEPQPPKAAPEPLKKEPAVKESAAPPRKPAAKKARPKKSPPKPSAPKAYPMSGSEPANAAPAAVRPDAAPVPSVPAAAGNSRPEAERGKVASAVLQALERYKKYPKAARRSGTEGRLMLTVRVGADGRIASCNVSTPSGKASLDAAGSLLAEKLIGIHVGASSPVTVVVPVVYSLSGS